MPRKQLSQFQSDEVNDFRIANGLKPIRKKEVLCLTCGKRFESQDYPRQRMCERCRCEESDFYSYQDSLMAG